MSIQTIPITKYSDLINLLNENSSNKNLIFRGQLDFDWPLNSTLQRHNPLRGKGDPSFDQMISQFIASVAKTSDLPYPVEDKISWLEYGQHYGLPTPCMDFSYSPFIALFFAFDGITKKNKTHSTIFILDKQVLAEYYTEMISTSNGVVDPQKFKDNFNTFSHPVNISNKTIVGQNGENVLPFFGQNNIYPFDKLQFFPYPKLKNERMIRQQGCFIYDSLDLRSYNPINSFESFCDSVPTSMENNEYPVLRKLNIPHNMSSDVFGTLENMNINASILYLDHAGAAKDVKNAFFYNPKCMHII